MNKLHILFKLSGVIVLYRLISGIVIWILTDFSETVFFTLMVDWLVLFNGKDISNVFLEQPQSKLMTWPNPCPVMGLAHSGSDISHCNRTFAKRVVEKTYFSGKVSAHLGRVVHERY